MCSSFVVESLVFSVTFEKSVCSHVVSKSLSSAPFCLQKLQWFFFLCSVMWTFIIIICLILGLLIMCYVGYLRSTFILGIYSSVWGNFLIFILWSFLLTLFSVEFLLLRCWTSSVIFDIYFLFFRPPHAACGIFLIIVLQLGHWELGVLTTGPPEKSQCLTFILASPFPS